MVDKVKVELVEALTSCSMELAALLDRPGIRSAKGVGSARSAVVKARVALKLAKGVG